MPLSSLSSPAFVTCFLDSHSEYSDVKSQSTVNLLLFISDFTSKYLFYEVVWHLCLGYKCLEAECPFDRYLFQHDVDLINLKSFDV